MNKRDTAWRISLLVLIINPRTAKKVEKAILEEKVPIACFLHGFGTNATDMEDVFGLEMPIKGLCMAPLPKVTAERVMKKLHRVLELGRNDSGIAFTIPIDGANALTLDMMEHLDTDHAKNKRSDSAMLADVRYTMITALINRGYYDEVMKAAREEGAFGGTIVHCRYAGDEEILTPFGVEFSEEKEMVLIVAEKELAGDIMSAISRECGMKTEAQGVVWSMPIDDVVGIGEY
mgnify:CR=1 FL=1